MRAVRMYPLGQRICPAVSFVVKPVELLRDLVTPGEGLQVCPVDLLTGQLQGRSRMIKCLVIAVFAGFSQAQ